MEKEKKKNRWTWSDSKSRGVPLMTPQKIKTVCTVCSTNGQGATANHYYLVFTYSLKFYRPFNINLFIFKVGRGVGG